MKNKPIDSFVGGGYVWVGVGGVLHGPFLDVSDLEVYLGLGGIPNAARSRACAKEKEAVIRRKIL